jgi:Nif-specific regulatory protein
MGDTDASALNRLTQERDLYAALLDVSTNERLEGFLEQALQLLIGATGAASGYIDVRPDGGDSPTWAAHACSAQQIASIRVQTSRGIVAEALASGRALLTNSALIDDRFSGRESVIARRIEAVICAPIAGECAQGVLYLEARAGAFGEQDRERVDLVARHLAPIADRLADASQRSAALDATKELRQRYRLEGFVGRSPAIAHALEQAMLAAPLDVTVLLTGPSGSGKSLLARAIHTNSKRAQAPFVELNCATLPETLFESELFGALAGSHSEAKRPQQGKVAAAEGGTLFLDEVGEIPHAAQAKLLQLLQSKQYYPLGAAAPQRANLRLIAATNADLLDLVRGRRFREDLYYRLHVLAVSMPSLAERRADLLELAEALANGACMRHGLPPAPLSATSQRWIATAEWPGNVRELENAIEAAAIRAAGEGAPTIEPRHLKPRPAPGPRVAEAFSFHDATREFQRELVERTLKECDWNVAEAARRLDLARSHLYNLIRQFRMEREAAG